MYTQASKFYLVSSNRLLGRLKPAQQSTAGKHRAEAGLLQPRQPLHAAAAAHLLEQPELACAQPLSQPATCAAARAANCAAFLAAGHWERAARRPRRRPSSNTIIIIVLLPTMMISSTTTIATTTTSSSSSSSGSSSSSRGR